MITHIPKVPWKDKLHFVCQFVPLIILRGLAVFAGFFVVPIALLFRKEDPTKAATGGGHHMPFISLPKWAWLWDNDEEGVASHFVPWWEQHDGNANTYWVMLKWSAFRNPANNMRFLKMFRLDMHKCDHEVVDDGFNFYTKSTDRDTGKSYYTFRRRKYYMFRGQNVSYIIHFGFKALRATLNSYTSTPMLFEHPHHRYRGFAIQLLPIKGYVKKSS